MIYKTAWVNPKGEHLLKINFEDGKGEVWVNTSEAVYNFAKKTLHTGDGVDVKYIEGGDGKNIERINKVGSNKVTDEKTDDRGSASGGNNYGKKSGFDSELSKRQTCMNATASILQSLVGEVSPDNVVELMETIYNEAIELINS